MSDGPAAQQQFSVGRGQAARFLLILLAALAVWASVFWAISDRLLTLGSASLLGAVDLSGAAEFETKLEAFSKLEGTKAAVVGDSFVFGESMAPLAGRNWRSQTLDRQFEHCLRGDKTGQAKVANFGMNGLLPADMLAITRRLEAAGADMVIVNVNSRSMSADFNDAANQYGRPWLKDARPASFGLFGEAGAKLSLFKRLSYGGTPADWGHRIAGSAGAAFADWTAPAVGDDLQVTLLKIKARYKTASYLPEKSAQAAALKELLAIPNVWAMRVIENPDLIQKVAGKSLRSSLDGEFAALVLASGAEARLLPAPDNLESADFIDLVHVTGNGYQKYAQAACQTISSRLAETRAKGRPTGHLHTNERQS